MEVRFMDQEPSADGDTAGAAAQLKAMPPFGNPRAIRYPRVQGSKIFNIRSRRWYSMAESSPRM
jgi:hypothetical protein